MGDIEIDFYSVLFGLILYLFPITAITNATMLAYEANIKIQQGWFLLEALGKNLSLVSSSS